MKRAIIRASQHGWVVSIDGDADFIPFKSNEPERLVKFLAERVVGIKLDTVIDLRSAEMAKARQQMEKVS